MSKIHCKAEGEMTPTVRWTKVNGEMPPHIQDVAGVLIFDGVKRADSGDFTCVATSRQGIINATIHVDVVGK